MTNAKKAPAKKPNAKKPNAKKEAPKKKPTAKKAPTPKTAPKTSAPATSAAIGAGDFGRAYTFITGKTVDDSAPSAVAPYEENWKICRCAEMGPFIGLAVLYAAAIHGPGIAIRLLRKASGQPLDAVMDDELLGAVNSASDPQEFLCVYSAWVMRRAAFAPKAHGQMWGWSNIILQIAMGDAFVAGLGSATAKTNAQDSDRQTSGGPDQKPSEMAAGVLHEPGTDGVTEAVTDAAESANDGAQGVAPEPRETSMGGQSAG